MTHVISTVLVALAVGMCGFLLAPRAIKYRYIGFKKQSFWISSLGQLYALAFGFSLAVPALYALSNDPKYQALFLGVISWVAISVVCAIKTYNRFRRVFGFLHEKAP